MGNMDLNLLVALDVLLAEGSVTGAARRLGLSSSAMKPDPDAASLRHRRPAARACRAWACADTTGR